MRTKYDEGYDDRQAGLTKRFPLDEEYMFGYDAADEFNEEYDQENNR